MTPQERDIIAITEIREAAIAFAVEAQRKNAHTSSADYMLAERAFWAAVDGLYPDLATDLIQELDAALADLGMDHDGYPLDAVGFEQINYGAGIPVGFERDGGL